MTNKIALVLAVVAIGIAGYAVLRTPQAVPQFGAAVDCTGSQNSTCLTGNLKLVDGGFQLGATAACIMVNPTSTATTINLKYLTVATTSANGFVTWSYGTCL